MRAVLSAKYLDRFSKIESPEEFKIQVFKMLGDLGDIEVMLNRVLVATYIQHEKRGGMIIRPTDSVAEDVWQGKACLVLKAGPMAFVSDSYRNFGNQAVQPGDWISARIGNADPIEIRTVPCRLILDEHIQARFADPRIVTS